MNGFVLLICVVLFLVGSKLEKQLVRDGYKPDRLVQAANGVKAKYRKPVVQDAATKQILDYESVEREKKEEYDAVREILRECEKVRKSPNWDGDECWIEHA